MARFWRSFRTNNSERVNENKSEFFKQPEYRFF